MKKRNIIRGMVLAFLTVSLSVTTVFASSIKDQSEKRLYGIDRFATAVAISQQGWTSSDSVVLADAYDFPDALSGVTLAYAKNAPILLTNTEYINPTTLIEIHRLNAKNIYILGGTGSISQNEQDSLTAMGYNVQRFSGADRFNTAISVGKDIVNNKRPDTVFLAYAYNFPDALSASTFAAEKGYPILFTDKDSINEDTKNAIENWGINNVYILGGTGVISTGVENNLKELGLNTTRLSGVDRYETAMQIIKNFDNGSYNGLTLASGQNFPDALAGSVLAVKENAPIMIYDALYAGQDIVDFIKSKSANIYVLGGEGVLPDQDIYNLQAHTSSETIDWDLTNEIRKDWSDLAPYVNSGLKTPVFDQYLFDFANGTKSSSEITNLMKNMSWQEEWILHGTDKGKYTFTCADIHVIAYETTTSDPIKLLNEIDMAGQRYSETYRNAIITYNSSTGEYTFYELSTDFIYTQILNN